jgi:hypothetical protein
MTKHAKSLVVLDTPLVNEDCQLVLNVPEQIITLLYNRKLVAQHHLSGYQFRLLALLLKLPGGALHAELLAILDCPAEQIPQVLAASSEQEVLTLLHPIIQRWRAHLAEQHHPQARRRELTVVRRTLTGQHGLNVLLRDFGLAAYPVYKQGYMLAPIPEQKRACGPSAQGCA